MNNVTHTKSLMKSAAANTPGPQKVLLVVGTPTLPDTSSFLKGYKDYAATNPDWKLVATVNTDFSAPDALTKTQNALQGHKDVTMIVTSYAGITDGVVQAVKAQGLAGKVAIYDQFAGSKQSVRLINGGELTGTLPELPGQHGAAAVQALVDAGNGTTPKRFIDNDGNPDAGHGAVTKKDVGITRRRSTSRDALAIIARSADASGPWTHPETGAPTDRTRDSKVPND